MRLEGRIAVITGGTRGLGRHLVAAFRAEGARVLYAGRTPAPDAPDGEDVAFHPVDVRDPASVRALMAEAQSRFGGVDIVVANAGSSRPGPVGELDPQAWAEVLDTNLTGALHCLQAALPHLEKSPAGRVINLSSALATRVAPGAAAYSVSKAGLEMLTRVAAVELAGRGITVNCVSPGFIDAGMGRVLADTPAVWARYEPKLATGRLGVPSEVSAAAVFLASDDGSYVNGHVLEVNGGLLW
jgi:3-oxoacyl-[acyl-carrier protein] reductase